MVKKGEKTKLSAIRSQLKPREPHPKERAECGLVKGKFKKHTFLCVIYAQQHGLLDASELWLAVWDADAHIGITNVSLFILY